MNVLPDSRLKNPIGTVMADWKMEDGTVIRIEHEQIFCPNCGKGGPWVPMVPISFAFWQCEACFEKYGQAPGTFTKPDSEFNADVAYEVERRFGRHLTDDELNRQIGNLGRPLEALERDSPFKAGRRIVSG